MSLSSFKFSGGQKRKVESITKPAKMTKKEKKVVKKEQTKRAKSKITMLKKEFGSAASEEKIDWSKIILRVPLQAHQVEAKKRIAEQRDKWGEFSNGLFLDLPMGYGKTISGLDVIVEYLNKYGNLPARGEHKSKGILIVCSSGDLRNQWCDEFKSKTNIPVQSNVFLWTETVNFPKVPTDGSPYIVLTTYRILLLANSKDVPQPWERNRWKIIITDEAHTYRNYKTFTSISLLRLILGKKASPELMTKMKKGSRKDDMEGFKDDIVHGRRKFSDCLIDLANEGSPASFRMFLSGTFMVNSIADLLIHAMIINQTLDECEVHDDDDQDDLGHEFNSETWWRQNLFVLMRDKDSLSEEKYQRGEEIYREFMQNFFISFTDEYIATILNLPKRTVIPHKCPIPEDSLQWKNYTLVAHTFTILYEKWKDHEILEEKYQSESVSVIRSQIMVCIQFLTMLSLHPACIRAELTRGSKEISKCGTMLIEAYEEYGCKEMSYKEPTVKILETINIIESYWAKDPNVQIIIFSAFRSFLDILYWHLAKRKSIRANNLARYHGGMSPNKKTEELERFKRGDAKILLSVFKTGSLGLNLTCATVQIMCDPPYTHATWIQAVCRMYRIGQKKPVFIHDLLSSEVDLWRLSKNTMKYLKQQEMKEKPLGPIDKNLTLKETQELYSMIVSKDTKISEEIKEKLREKEAKILRLHVSKIADTYEKMLNDYSLGDDENDGKDDGFVFNFDEDFLDESSDDEDENYEEEKPYSSLIDLNDIPEEEIQVPRYERKFDSDSDKEDFSVVPKIRSTHDPEPYTMDDLEELMEILGEIPKCKKQKITHLNEKDLIEF